MKTDRELIELAARAAGLTVMWSEPFKRYERFTLEKYAGPWDPLNNDGDAFRLAVSLQMELRVFNGSAYAEPFDGEKVWQDGNCPLAVTRRAIVMAAADIGEQL